MHWRPSATGTLDIVTQLPAPALETHHSAQACAVAQCKSYHHNTIGYLHASQSPAITSLPHNSHQQQEIFKNRIMLKLVLVQLAYISVN